MKYEDIRIFLSEVALGVIEHDLDQDSGLLSSGWVLQQGHLDMSVTDRQQSWRAIARDSGKLHNQGQLHTVPFVRVGRLHGGVERFQELELILRM
jgi:hypothetical protein